MEFLKTFFGVSTTNPKPKKSQGKKVVEVLHLRGPRPEQQKKGNQMENVQQKLLKKHSTIKPKAPQVMNPAALQTKILGLNQKTETGLPSKMDLGLLVGVVNKQKKQNQLVGACIQVSIGKAQEINCIHALRPHSLDSILVFWNNQLNQFTLNQLLSAPQKFIFVIQSWETLQTFIKNYETALFELFAEKNLIECGDKLLFNIYEMEHRYVLEFQDSQKFTNKFVSNLQDTFPSLAALEHLQQFMDMMTLEEYAECCHLTSERSHIKSRIQTYKNVIQKQIEEEKKKEELERVSRMLEIEAEEDSISQAAEPVRKNSSYETELEAAYFGKKQNRTSTQQTRASGSSKRQDNEQLYYFIEEHDQSDEECSDNEKEQDSQDTRIPNSPTRLSKSKSLNQFVQQPRQEVLDDEFFTKY